MEREFIETNYFRKCWKGLKLSDDDLRVLQEQILSDPDCGDLIQNTGGARKMRMALQGRGKSGSARIIYIDFVVTERVYLLMAYPKSQMENLSDSLKNEMYQLIKTLKQMEGERRNG